MTGELAVTGVAVGVSQPAAFMFKDVRYRFDPLPEADADVARLKSRIQTLAQAAGVPLIIPAIVGGAATHGAILDEIGKQLSLLKPGGLFILILEGHGTDIPDVDGDERALGFQFDQVFPTVDDPIVDDEFGKLWATRPDITLFNVADTCRAETLFRLTGDISRYRGLGVIVSRDELVRRLPEPTIHLQITETGPSVIQFAASARATNAGDIQTDAGLSGRFTQAVLQASTDVSNLASFRSWFVAADRIVRTDSGQEPVLYYMGNSASLIDQRPPFVP
jgi:hypothetical protein